MQRSQQGFTLLELIIVVAIIGILAAIALPSYSDYMRKTKVTEVMLALTPPKSAVIEHVNATASFPTAQQLDLRPASSQYVESVTYTKTSDTEVNVAAVVKAGSIGPDLDGTRLVLTGKPGAAGLSTGSVEWTCSGTIPDKYLTVACRSGS